MRIENLLEATLLSSVFFASIFWRYYQMDRVDAWWLYYPTAINRQLATYACRSYLQAPHIPTMYPKVFLMPLYLIRLCKHSFFFQDIGQAFRCEDAHTLSGAVALHMS